MLKNVKTDRNAGYCEIDIETIDIFLEQIEKDIEGLCKINLLKLKVIDNHRSQMYFFGLCGLGRTMFENNLLRNQNYKRIIPILERGKSPYMCDIIFNVIDEKYVYSEKTNKEIIDRCWNPRIEWLKFLRKHILKLMKNRKKKDGIEN